MRMFRALDISGSSLTAHRLWLDAIASNLANANTTRTAEGGPYRRKVPIFAEMLDGASRGEGGTGGVRVMEIVSDDAPPRLAYQPDHPDADEEGYVAFPNVNVVREMTDMLVASRAYEANLAVADSARSMWSGALEIMRG